MEEAGFVDVKEVHHNWPMGGDQRPKESYVHSYVRCFPVENKEAMLTRFIDM